MLSDVFHRRVLPFTVLNDGETIVFNTSNGHYYGLTGAVKEVWGLVDGVRTIRQIKQELLQSYEVSSEQIERDVDQSVADLVQIGLIEPANTAVQHVEAGRQ